MAQTIILTEEKSEIVKLLEAHVQSGNLNFLFGSGASMPAINVAKNIEKEINDLLAKGEDAQADKKALEFLEELEDVNNDVVANITGGAIEDVLTNYTTFLEAVDQLVFERKNLLLPRQANIFTTNYDFFFEQAASDLPTVVLNDGFDRTSAAIDGFPFSPEKYFDRTFRSGNVYDRQAEVPSINLIKIHGSLSWARGEGEYIRYSLREHKALSDEERDDPEKVRTALTQRAIILPNVRKFESTVLDRVYFDLLRLYSNSLDKENALLFTFGFSFADEHILDVTRRALRNPTAKLIIFSYSEEAAVSFAEKFKQQRNVLVISPAKGANIDFPEMNSLFQGIAPLKRQSYE
ncbi:SIR2 family protein [Sinisalibacter lacisalsi]|uniref:SIR2-like domain-containing protein n=1 Tax=Sinisalibacter lacisalsi TaxID=1526570 RepID=A0ABQ1QMB1_9RHOB|nr:SIR2 family protein [Sinisalibacter lacisalsi]GGD35265.1 hypothetical protein GCM10011358_19030 [Sinisalibacter lacisalsi]